MMTAGRELPFLFRGARVGFSLLGNHLLNRLNNRIRVLVRRHHYLYLIPEPLPAGGEIKEVAFDGKAVDECNFATRRMSGVSPIAGLEKNGAQQIDLHHFPDNSVDLHPISHAQTIAAHQHEPTEE